jgi:hypothetical protein
MPAGQLDGDAGGDGLRGARDEDGPLERAQVHGGVLVGAVRVAGKRGVGMKLLDADLHLKVLPTQERQQERVEFRGLSSITK